jgi:hypothetical protein
MEPGEIKRYCACGELIPEGRMKATKGKATTCVGCSTTGKVSGHAMITGKTEYSDLQIVDAETAKRLARLGQRRGYGVSSGVAFDSDKNGTSNYKLSEHI